MPNDIRQVKNAIPAELTCSLAGTETPEVGNPLKPVLVPAGTPANCHVTPEFCRECLAATAHRLAQPATALRGGIELGLLGKHSVAEYRAILEQSLELADNMAQLIVSLRDLGESSAPAGSPREQVFRDLRAGGDRQACC